MVRNLKGVVFLLMSFDNPDLDYDPLQDEDDFGLGIMSNVGDIHDALDEPPPDFWDEMLNEPDEYADDERNDIVPDQQYFSWSDAVARDAVDVSQPHVFDGSSRDSTGIAKSAVPATSTAPAPTNPVSPPESRIIGPQVKRVRLRSKVSSDDVRIFPYTRPPELPLRWGDDTQPASKPSKKDRNNMWGYIWRKWKVYYDATYPRTYEEDGEEVDFYARRSAMRQKFMQLSIAEKENFFLKWVTADNPGNLIKSMLKGYCDDATARTAEDRKVFRLRTCGLWTWVSYEWQLRYIVLPPGDDWAEIEAVVRKSPMAIAYRKQFQKFLDDSLLPYLNYPKYRCSMEICPQTYRATGKLQVHFHLYWYQALPKAERITACAVQEEFKFRGISPWMPAGSKECDTVPCEQSDFQSNMFRQRGVDKTRTIGLFYVSAPKIGHVFDFGNVHLSWSQVAPALVTKLFADGKISVENTKLCYLNCVTNARFNIEQLQYVVDKRQELASERRMKVKKAAVMAEMKRRRYIHEIEADWLPGLVNLNQPRNKLVVLDGDSQMGKTSYARQLAEKEEYFFEADCCGKDFPDINGLCNTKHRVALFDECSAQTVLKNKRLMQGNIFGGSIGNSATNKWSKRINTWGVGIVVATNNWEADVAELEKDEDKEWLAKNCIVVPVTEPLWVE